MGFGIEKVSVCKETGSVSQAKQYLTKTNIFWFYEHMNFELLSKENTLYFTK